MTPKTLLLLGLAVSASFACGKEGAAPAPAASAPAAPAASPTTVAAPAPSGAEVAVGQPAPDFDVTASDGAHLKLSALRGRPVVVYFYPKDETPGCTREACAFRDAWDKLGKTNVVLVGVSADSDASHRAFAEHHKLPFHLVSDPDEALAKRFGVPHFGRQSFVVGPDGRIKKVYRTVDVAAHAQEILSDVGS